MDISKTINKITGENTPFSFDVRYNEKGEQISVLIIKSNKEDICFEPLISHKEITEDDIQSYYESIKEDKKIVDKFLGVKIARETKSLEEKISPPEDKYPDIEPLDLDF